MNLDKHFITGVLRGRPYLAATVVLTAAAAAMTQMPLVADLGFEFAFLTAFIATFATGLMTVHLVAGWRSDSVRNPRLPALLALLFGLSLSTLLLPLAVMFVKSWISGFCNVSEGFAFYLLLPGISVLWSTAVALPCALATKRRLRATLLFLGVMFLSIAISLYRLATQPPVFAYNPIIGYFPGPIYDEVVVITTTLLTARAIVLVSVLAIAAGLSVCFDPSTWKIRPALFLKIRGGGQDGASSDGGSPDGGGPDEGRVTPATTASTSSPATTARTATMGITGIVMRVLFVASLAVLAAAYVYRAPLGIVIDRAHIQQTLGGHRQTEHFDIYYDRNTITDWNLELIAREHEYQLDRVIGYLDVPPPSTRIASYIYAHADQKKRLMGARHTSMERPGSDEMHLNNASFPHPVLKHELVHVVSAAFGNALYGGSYWIGFHEGLAEAVDWQNAPMNPHEWSRAMRELGLAPPLENLLSMTGFWTAASSRSYTLCGSFVRFLIEQYGLPAFKQAFPEGAVEEAYGRTPAELVAEWEAFVDSIQLREDQLRIARQWFIRPAIFRRRCPHEVAALNDRAWQAYRAGRYSDAVGDFDRVLELEPENPSALRGLLYGTYRLEDYERTESVVARMTERPDQTVGLLADAHLIRGDTAWKTGRSDDARGSWETVVDLHASEAMSRAAFIRLGVLDREQIQESTMAYLTATRGQWSLVEAVRDASDLVPDYGAGYYLTGRWLYLSSSFEQALTYLSKADALELPGEPVRQENLRLAAMSHFYLKDYEQSAETFGRLAALAGTGGVARTSEAWIDRCRWYQAAAESEDPDR